MSNFKSIKPKQMQDNPFNIIGQDWMLITAQNEGKINTMTASWGGLGVMWGKNVAYVVIRPQRYTKEFVDAGDTFSLSFLPDTYRKEMSYIGSVSGRDEDKIATANLTVETQDGVPYFDEARMVLVCKKLFAQPMTEDSFVAEEERKKWYPQEDYHTLYIAEIQDILVKD